MLFDPGNEGVHSALVFLPPGVYFLLPKGRYHTPAGQQCARQAQEKVAQAIPNHIKSVALIGYTDSAIQFNAQSPSFKAPQGLSRWDLIS